MGTSLMRKVVLQSSKCRTVLLAGAQRTDSQRERDVQVVYLGVLSGQNACKEVKNKTKPTNKPRDRFNFNAVATEPSANSMRSSEARTVT